MRRACYRSPNTGQSPAASTIFNAPRLDIWNRQMAIQQQPPLAVTHVDIAELAETFADSVNNVVWDGQTLRVDLSVTRYPEPAQMASGAKRYPVCRLVLTPTAAADLFERLRQSSAAIAKGSEARKAPT
jgi:hypothetical protein